MKSIMIICNSLGTGGAEKQTVVLANGLYRNGWKVIFIYLTPIHDQLNRLDESLRETVFNINRDAYLDFKTIASIKKLIKSHKITTILSVNQLSLMYAILAKGLNNKIKVFAGFHTTKLIRGEVIKFYLLSWWLFKLANKVVFVCRNQMEYWSHRVLHANGNGFYIYNGVDTDQFAPVDVKTRQIYRRKLNIDDNAFVLVSIAMLRPEKRHIDMLPVIKKLRDHGIDALLLCVGDGPERTNIVNLASKLDIQEHIKMIGRVNDVKQYIAVSDVMLLLSNAVETFSIAVLESLSSGCPVVAYDIGGVREQIVSEKYGYVLPMADMNALLDALINLKQRLHAIDKWEIHEYVEKNFSCKKMISDYENIFLV